MNSIFRILISTVTLAVSAAAFAQTSVHGPVEKAEKLRQQYRFSEAVDLLEEALESCSAADSSAIEDALLPARNGESMTDFCVVASPVAKRRFSKKDFFLWLPMADRSWRSVPNVLDPSSDAPVAATFVREGDEKIYFSAPDEEGMRNIYMTMKLDSVWTAPELVDEKLTSSADEICPLLSPDGKHLYFASSGLYGMGGFDIYVSDWNESTREWEAPVNMGIPYSSPYNDYLFMHTSDGLYTIFASDRECPGTDSVWVYVTDFDSMPVRRSVSDPSEAWKMSILNPSGSSRAVSGTEVKMPSDPKTLDYINALRELKAMKKRMAEASGSLDRDRASVADMQGAEKERLSAEILDREMELIGMQDSLKKKERELQAKELDLFAEGLVIDPSVLDAATASNDGERTTGGFSFTKNTMGGELAMTILRPEPSFDYSFMILDEGRFAEDNTLPEGIVYQIQIFTSSSPATVKRLKGLSPVFMRRAGSSYIYSAGVFRTYSDCLSNLNKVKRLGFKSAFITAFLDGEKITVSKARTLESEVVHLYNVTVVPSGGKALSEAEKTAIHAVTSADLSRTVADGVVTYVIGPFSDKAEASSVVSMLRAAGVSSAAMSEVRQ